MALDFNRAWAKFWFTAGQRKRTYSKLSSLLNNGIPIREAMEMLHWQASRKGKKPNESMAIVYMDILRKIKEGNSVSTAFAPWVPMNEAMMLHAGEQAGVIETVMLRINESIDTLYEIYGALSGLLYPAVLFAGACAVLWMFGAEIIPQFASTMDTSKWGGDAKTMIQISDLIRAWGLPAAVAFVAFIALLLMSMPRWTGRYRIIADVIPPWSIYRLVIGSQFVNSLSTLIGAGERIEVALRKMKANSSPWLAERIAALLFNMKQGHGFGTSLDAAGHKFPSQEVIDDLVIYERMSGLDISLANVASEWKKQGVASLKAQLAILSLFAMLVMTAIIAGIGTGMFAMQQEIANSSMVSK